MAKITLFAKPSQNMNYAFQIQIVVFDESAIIYRGFYKTINLENYNKALHEQIKYFETIKYIFQILLFNA